MEEAIHYAETALDAVFSLSGLVVVIALIVIGFLFNTRRRALFFCIVLGAYTSIACILILTIAALKYTFKLLTGVYI